MSLDIPPPISTLRIWSPSWNNFSTPSMKKLIKQSWKAYPLGIQISPILEIPPFSSNLERTTLRGVESEKKPALKLCNFVPLSNSIMYFHPYLCLCIKPSMIDFDYKISNQCFPWIYSHNAHTPKPCNCNIRDPKDGFGSMLYQTYE